MRKLDTSEGLDLLILQQVALGTAHCRGVSVTWVGREVAHGGIPTAFWDTDASRCLVPLESRGVGFQPPLGWSLGPPVSRVCRVLLYRK